MKITLSSDTEDEMRDIFEYVSKFSTKHALETILGIRLYIYKLKESPYLGRYVLELSETKNIREILYKNYRIVYEVFEESNYIYIHFIIHKKQNLKNFYKSYLKNNF